MANDLQSITVLVTRPDPAGAALCEMVTAHGGQPFPFPVIAFAPPEDETTFRRALQAIGEQDWLIFNSPQAVAATVPAMRAVWPHLPERVKFAAVGAGTAAALREAGYIAALFPENEWSSEGLLAMPAFQSIAGQRIMVVRGEGGRELLERVLMERQALVTSCLAYKRVLPAINPETCQRAIQDHLVSVVVAGSFESVTNLKLLLGEDSWPGLRKIPLIVMSERIKKLAAETGFQTIWVTQNPSQQAVMDLISEKKDVLCQITNKK